MNRRLGIFAGLIGAALVAGCAPIQIYHQAGTPVAAMRADTLTCELAALRDVPVATQIRQEPARYVPARRLCDAEGHCVVRGGYFIEGDIYLVDVNAGLRARAEMQCMANKGYTRISLPRCDSGVARRVPQSATQVLPPVGPQSCAVRNPDGTLLIVDVRPKPDPGTAATD